MTRLGFTLAAAALLLAGCAKVGPNFAQPAPPPGSASRFVAGERPVFSTAPLPDDWWRLYEDPTLDRYVSEALAANRDLGVAAANLARARAVLREVRDQRLPQTGTSASATYGRQSAAGQGLDQSFETNTVFDLGLDASYEVDLFGRVGRAIEAARADSAAAEAALDVVRVSVAGETARAYANACSAAEQLNVGRLTLRLQDDTLTLTRRILDAGRGTRLDVARAQAERERTASTLPLFEAERDRALFRLAVLTGRAPAELPPATFTCTTTPRLRQAIPIGDGAELIRRRPDIRQAEAELAAATARIGVATADLYPRISLGGSIGSTSTSIGDLASGPAFRFGIGPLISWSFPNLGAARARIRQAEATAQGALAQFDSTVLEALGETETALSRYARELDRRSALLSARDASADAAQLARLRFRNGADSFLSVLDAERTLSEAEAALADSERQIADYQVTLFKALGGGWQSGAALSASRQGSR
jgi:NodT family efflux transporter outer membrane factor (OMF) lipoprotein